MLPLSTRALPLTLPPFRFDTYPPLDPAATVAIRLAFGIASAKGTRPTMEDAHVAHLPVRLPADPGASAAIFGVFDGHGGDLIAHTAARHLPNLITAHSEVVSAPPRALVGSFLSFDRAVHTATQGAHGGCVAITALVVDDVIYIANLGDARAVVLEGTGSTLERTVALSEDHRPGLPAERARVEAAGSFVLSGRVGGFLAVSRALGDYGFKTGLHEDGVPLVVSNIPDISSYTITDTSRALVLACDGLWDVVPNHFVGEVVLAVLSGASPSRAAHAAYRRMKELHYPLTNPRPEVMSSVGSIHTRSSTPCDKVC